MSSLKPNQVKFTIYLSWLNSNKFLMRFFRKVNLEFKQTFTAESFNVFHQSHQLIIPDYAIELLNARRLMLPWESNRLMQSIRLQFPSVECNMTHGHPTNVITFSTEIWRAWQSLPQRNQPVFRKSPKKKKYLVK